MVLAVALAVGCQSSKEHGHEHGDKEEHSHNGDDDDHAHGEGHSGHEHDDDDDDEGDDHGHGHGHDGASEVVTLWGDRTQLFVEFPALVAGEDSPFAAHLTRLSDHLAIDHGDVIVELTGGSQPIERFSVHGASVPGIFRPVVRPASAGRRKVTLRLESPDAAEVHELGEFTVYGSREAADEAAGPEEESDDISYLLEQQWKVPFRIEHVAAREMRPNFPAFARLVKPSDAESIVSAPRDGRLVAAGGRFPLVGESFAAGTALFALGAAPQEGAEPATLDLATDQARIRVASSQREVDRLTPLVEQGVVAQRRLDEATSALAQAKAELKSARRRRASLGQSQQIDGGRDGLNIPSPINGKIAELYVAPGAWVSAGDPIARIVDPSQLWLDVGVPEAYVGRIGEVSGAWFKLDNVDGVIDLPQSALVSIGTEVDTTTRTLPVRFRVDNIRREFFAGMSAQAHLVADAPQLTVAVPSKAVVDDGGMDVVYVQTGGESFARRAVKLGIRDGDYVEVLEGVAPGEWVVADGAYSVKLASSSTESVGHGHAH